MLIMRKKAVGLASLPMDLIHSGDEFISPDYSPNSAPSDFHLFPKLNEFMGGNWFENNEELKETLIAYPNGLATEEFDNRFQKLVKRWHKCLNVYGNYVEK